MVRLVIGVFMVLHGLVHLLYVGQSQKLFELQPGLAWPDGSWVFSRVLGDERARLIAAILLVVAAAGFVIGGAGILAGQAWWRPIVVGSAAFSSIIFVLYWNGTLQRLSEQGLFALLINAAILTAVLVFKWPDFGF